MQVKFISFKEVNKGLTSLIYAKSTINVYINVYHDDVKNESICRNDTCNVKNFTLVLKYRKCLFLFCSPSEENKTRI